MRVISLICRFCAQYIPDVIGPCQFPSWDLDRPVIFHHVTNQFSSYDLKPEPSCVLWPSQLQLTWVWKPDPMQYGGDCPHHHLTMWVTSATYGARHLGTTVCRIVQVSVTQGHSYQTSCTLCTPQKFFRHSYDLRTNFVAVTFASVHILPKCDIYVLSMPPQNPDFSLIPLLFRKFIAHSFFFYE